VLEALSWKSAWDYSDPSFFLMHRILYRIVAAPTLLAVRSGRSKDLEIVVL